MADTASPPNNSLQQQNSVTEANDVLQKSLHIGGAAPPSDPADRFRGKGTTFKAKLIGVEDVPESRGDQMCQEAILKLKAIVKASGEHKTKIIINVSLEGLKIIELLTGTILHTHPVHLISFIARDLTDRRAFGYIFGVEEGKHQFFGIKTQKAAELLVLALRDLFQVVYEMKKKEMETAKTQQAQQPQNQPEEVYAVPNNRPVAQQPPPDNNILNLKQELDNMHQMSGLDAFNPWPDNAPTSPDTPASPAPNDMFGMNDSANTNPPNRSGSYGDDLAALSLTAAQPAAMPGAKLTKDQILSSFTPAPTNQNPQAAYFGQQQPAYGGQQGGFIGQPAFGAPQQPMFGAPQQQMFPPQPTPNPFMATQPYAQQPMGGFAPAPSIPVRTGAMQPPNNSVQSGAPQNPFGDAMSSNPEEILSPVNQIPESLNPESGKKGKPDPFAALIPGMGTGPTNKKDMFKDFQMSKPPPPPRTNESVSPNFDSYLRNSVGGVPVDTQAVPPPASAPTPAPRGNSFPTTNGQPEQDLFAGFGMTNGDQLFNFAN